MKSPTRTAFPVRKRVSWDSGTPRPRAMFSVDSETVDLRARAECDGGDVEGVVVVAVRGEDRRRGADLGPGRPGVHGRRVAADESRSGGERLTTASREGRVRKASTRNCVRPSSSSSVLVP